MSDAPRRLVIETAGEAVGVAVAVEESVLTSAWVTTSAASSELVMSMVGDALDKTGVSRDLLTELVACRGPGSFTGIRVGLATVRGLAFGLSIPVRTLSAFEVELAGVNEFEGPVVVALDARRGQLYVQGFGPRPGAARPGASRPSTEPAVVDPSPTALRLAREGSDRRAPLLVGTGIDRYPDAFAAAFPDAVIRSPRPPRVESLARGAGWGWGSAEVSPVYLRPPDAKLPGGVPPSGGP